MPFWSKKWRNIDLTSSLDSELGKPSYSELALDLDSSFDFRAGEDADFKGEYLRQRIAYYKD